MIFTVKEDYLSNPLPRLDPRDVSDFQVRILKLNEDIHLIYFDDYDDSILAKVILENRLNPDKVGLVIDETKVVRNPNLYIKARTIVSPNKLYVRQIHSIQSKKKITEALHYFENTEDWNKFDNYVYSLREDENYQNVDYAMERVGSEVKVGIKTGVTKGLEGIKSDFKSAGIKLGVAAGGAVALNAILNKVTKDYAEKDAKKSPFLRSKLIADLRVLKGKLPEYENQYERTRREDYERSNFLMKIILKIKYAIEWILIKLGLKKGPYD